MAIAATLLKRSKTSGVFIATLRLVASGSYTTGGDVLVPIPEQVAGFTSRSPDFVDIIGINGFIYKYNLSSDKILVYIPTAVSGNTGFAQHSAAAYDAGVTGDTITAMFMWFATPGLTA